MNFLKNLIKGDYGLGKTFWVYGTLYQLIFSLVIFITFFFFFFSIDKSLINYSQIPELIIKQIFLFIYQKISLLVNRFKYFVNFLVIISTIEDQ